MARFNKAALISQLRKLNEAQLRVGAFDSNNGTAQLHPSAQDDHQLHELIDRAVAYGRWQQTRDILYALESGDMGK